MRTETATAGTARHPESLDARRARTLAARWRAAGGRTAWYPTGRFICELRDGDRTRLSGRRGNSREPVERKRGVVQGLII